MVKSTKYLSLKINNVSSNSADPDKMPHAAAFHHGLHCLPKYSFNGWFPVHKVLQKHTMVLYCGPHAT